MYYRQIHPNAIKLGALTSLAFQPSSKDNAVSTFDGKQITAEESFDYWVNGMGRASVGVLAVTDDELNNLSIDYPYSGEKHTVTCSIKVDNDGVPIPSHTNLIFPDFLNSHQIKAIQRYLCKKASDRNWIYKTSESTNLIEAASVPV